MQTFFSVLIVIWLIILLMFKCHDHFLLFPLFKMKKPQCLQRRLTICKVTTTAILADAQELQEYTGIKAQMAGYLQRWTRKSLTELGHKGRIQENEDTAQMFRNEIRKAKIHLFLATKASFRNARTRNLIGCWEYWKRGRLPKLQRIVLGGV